MLVNIKEDGTIDGYLTIVEWAEKNNINVNTARKLCFDGVVPMLKIKKADGDYFRFIPASFKHKKSRGGFLNADIPGYVSTTKYAEIKGISRQMAYNHVKSGKVEAIKIFFEDRGEDRPTYFIKLDEEESSTCGASS